MSAFFLVVALLLLSELLVFPAFTWLTSLKTEAQAIQHQMTKRGKDI